MVPSIVGVTKVDIRKDNNDDVATVPDVSAPTDLFRSSVQSQEV
eukprot:CAMPEP_0206204456 /NCGR_PEP_ID=MMETSP0166-20121206/13535_1 /ASSEMBLY_ACC=CAM_ASM_000260 /TAXON_ID=95228 /ORGANISM="Vannella robusta, Strain DIVA3 518/3/11/1/6" /LENGTH=43 /DNA_ID= /DNA_START= /DNA_END= /DNA_ORIENTATION=